jgi:hypothetical protein
MIRISRLVRLCLAVGIAAGLAVVSVALAATPSSGTLSTSTPQVKWSGTLTSSGIFYNLWTIDPTLACAPPTCDPFTLKVADGVHNMSIKLNINSENATGGDPGAGIRVQSPDGAYQYTQGTAGAKTTMTLKFKDPKPGDYEINTVASHVCCGDDPYTQRAEIPELIPVEEGGTLRVVPQLTLKASGVSARKLAKSRKYKVTVTTTAPLTKVTAKLLKGKKSLASAKAESLEGTATLVLKLTKKAKPKAGTYTLVVSGVDGAGTQTTAAVKIKFRR